MATEHRRSGVGIHGWRLLLGASVVAALSNQAALADGDGSGMKVSASVDATAAFRTSKNDPTPPGGPTDRFDIREAEVMFYGPVDHLFDGMLSLAAHREDGVSLVEIHEAHLSSSKLIARSRIKAGQFFPAIGRLNRQHRHEWPFVSAPAVQAHFFGSEGLIDTGLEYGYLAPLPFYLDLTAGVTNGWVYGHAHDEGEKPKTPTHYLRAATYSPLPANGGAEIGINGLSRTDAAGERTMLTGLDAVAKWRNGGQLKALVQGEAWHRARRPAQGALERTLGSYVLPQVSLTPVLAFGVRFDYMTVLSLEDAAGDNIPNRDQGVVPVLTYKPSEFSTLRVSYAHMEKSQDGTPNEVRRLCELQLTYSLGAHPAHDF